MTVASHAWFSCIAVVSVFSAVGQFLLVVGIAFVVLSGVASFLRFHFMTARDEAASEDDLLPQDVFHLRIIQRLGTVHRDPSPFCVLLMSVRDLDEFVRTHGAETGDQILTFVQEITSEVVRRTDVVAKCDDNTIGLVLDVPRARVAEIVGRILAAIGEATCKCSSGLDQRMSVNLGIATCPENGERAVVLDEAVRTALQNAESGRPDAYRLAAAEESAQPEDEEEEAPNQASLIDPLTGVLRSDRLPRAMQKYIARLRKEDEPVSVLHVDVDYLGRYNEHYGEGAGDMLLQGVGRLLQEILREDDLIARYGEDDFMILMAGPPEGGLVAAQRVAGEVKKTSFDLDGTSLKITASVGVAGCPLHGTTQRQLMEASGRALRAAKTKGRGVCMIYDEAMRTQHGEVEKKDVF